jgi:hypothetical protein
MPFCADFGPFILGMTHHFCKAPRERSRSQPWRLTGNSLATPLDSLHTTARGTQRGSGRQLTLETPTFDYHGCRQHPALRIIAHRLAPEAPETICQKSRCPRCWRCRSRRRRTRRTRCQSPPTSPDCPSSWSPSAVLQWGQLAKDLVHVMKKTRSPPAPDLLLHPQKLLDVSLACALQPCLTKYITSNLV